MKYKKALHQDEKEDKHNLHTFDNREEKRLKDTDPALYAKLKVGLEPQSRHKFMSDNGKYIYHLGIIDYLQDFGWEKLGEHKWKSLQADGTKISAVPPSNYKERYFRFMQYQVIINQELTN